MSPGVSPRIKITEMIAASIPVPRGSPAAACFSGSLSGTHTWSGPGSSGTTVSVLEFRVCESLCTASKSTVSVSCNPSCQLLVLDAQTVMQKWGAGSRGTAPWPWRPLAGPPTRGSVLQRPSWPLPTPLRFPPSLLSFPPLPLCSDGPRIIGSDPRRPFGTEVKDELAKLPVSLPGRRWSVSLVFRWTAVPLAL